MIVKGRSLGWSGRARRVSSAEGAMGFNLTATLPPPLSLSGERSITVKRHNGLSSRPAGTNIRPNRVLPGSIYAV
jgi:hypothetical protein